MTYDQIAAQCRHARLGYLDGLPGTPQDVAIRLRELDQSVRWWQALANRLIRSRLGANASTANNSPQEGT